MEAIKRFIEKLSTAGEPVWPPITVEPSGFRTRDRTIQWSDIKSVSAFKRDMITIDDIWFQLEVADGHVMLCEEQPGFNDWVLALEEQFPSVVAWQDRVVQPPFVENFTFLYSRT